MLTTRFTLVRPDVITEQISSDGTRKWLLSGGPGIAFETVYIPEENLGVRIEDDILITDTGFEFLSKRLPRDPAEIEKMMAEAARARTGEPSRPD